MPLCAANIRQKLAGTSLPRDPARVILPEGARHWPPRFLASVTKALKPAGVLIPLIERPDGLSVLLTQRSSRLRLHAGQVSFPGGRMDPADTDILATALREAHEEVGIEPNRVDVAGFLDPLPTITGYAVTPVVGLIGPDVSISIDPGEVEAAFEVPLAFLLDAGNEVHSEREFEGETLPIVEFNHGGRRIWGATATMLIYLRKLLNK